MPREDPTRPARKHRLQQSRDVAEGRIARARERGCDDLRFASRLVMALSLLRSALVIGWDDPETAWDMVAAAYVALERER